MALLKFNDLYNGEIFGLDRGDFSLFDFQKERGRIFFISNEILFIGKNEKNTNYKRGIELFYVL